MFGKEREPRDKLRFILRVIGVVFSLIFVKVYIAVNITATNSHTKGPATRVIQSMNAT